MREYLSGPSCTRSVLKLNVVPRKRIVKSQIPVSQHHQRPWSRVSARNLVGEPLSDTWKASPTRRSSSEDLSSVSARANSVSIQAQVKPFQMHASLGTQQAAVKGSFPNPLPTSVSSVIHLSSTANQYWLLLGIGLSLQYMATRAIDPTGDSRRGTASFATPTRAGRLNLPD